MNLSEIIDKTSKLNVFEKRNISDGYFEFVIFKTDIEEWCKLFTDLLGSATKPAGVNPTKVHQEMTKDYGGIMANQILFKKDFNGQSVIAMFWPWRDDVHITLKTVLLAGNK